MLARRSLLAAAAAGTLTALARPRAGLAVEVGQKAPEFTLPAPGPRQVKLSELTARGPVAIYTFIQAFTGT